MSNVECHACAAGLPLVWSMQEKKTMHLAPGLCLESCKRLDAREQRAKDIANDRGNEDQRGR